MPRAIKALEAVGVIIKRDDWLGHAETAERTGMPAVCRSIVRTIAFYGVEDEDREATLMGDAEEFLKKHPPCMEVRVHV